MHQTMCGGRATLIARLHVVITGYGGVLQIVLSIVGSSHCIMIVFSLEFVYHILTAKQTFYSEL